MILTDFWALRLRRREKIACFTSKIDGFPSENHQNTLFFSRLRRAEKNQHFGHFQGGETSFWELKRAEGARKNRVYATDFGKSLYNLLTKKLLRISQNLRFLAANP